MKRKLALLLALLMMFTLLAGCQKTSEESVESTEKTETPEVPAEKVKILITTQANPHERLGQLATALKERLVFFGYAAEVAEDNGTRADANAYEIYLGDVASAEMTELRAELGSCGWGVKVAGKKLCLAGTSPDLVNLAWQSISQKAFADLDSPFAGIEKQVMAYDSMVTLLENKTPDMSFAEATENETVASLIGNLKSKIANHSRISAENLKDGKVLIKLSLLDESNGFDFNTYSIKSQKDSIEISATDAESLSAAADAFYNMLVSISNFKTSKVLCFPEGTILGIVNQEVPVLPFDAAASLYDANVNGTYTLAWNATKPATMDAYAKKLEALGYEQIDFRDVSYQFSKNDPLYESDSKTYSNNFRTYSNGVYEVYMYYLEGTGNLRVSATSLAENRALENLRIEGATTGEGTPSFTLLNIGGESEDGIDFMTMSGMNFAFKLSDGRFIIVDGGEWEDSDTNASDVKRFYNWLKENSNDGKIVIAAWFLTHHHSDHVNVAWKFEELYGKEVTIQRFMYSFPSMEYALTAPESDVNKPYYDKVFPRNMTMLEKYECIVPRTGMVYQIGDAEIEVLYTHDDFYPNPLKDYNNSSTAVKITLGGKSFLIAGDLEEPGQEIACHQNGTRLDSDYVQSTHHSWNGLELYFRYGIGNDGTSCAIWPLNHGVRWPNTPQDGIEHNNTYYRTIDANNWLYNNSAKDYFAYHGIQTIPLG